MKDRKDFFDLFMTRLKSIFNELEFIKTIFVPIHQAGYPFIIIFGLVSLIMGSFSDFLGWLGLVLTLWCVYFFRDPLRVTPEKQGIVISPADGKVLPITNEFPPEDATKKEKMKKISIFMNVFNVHSNRSPIAGEVQSVEYIPGDFFNADLDKASESNERNSIVIVDNKGRSLTCVQIAGLIARRICCYVSSKDKVKRGARIGFIRFGSRVDIYLPKDCTPLITVGDKIYAHSSALALWPKT